MTSASNIRAAESRLRQLCPPPKGTTVKVKLVSPDVIGGSEGLCSKWGREFTIYIDNTLDDRFGESVLVHEWAHIMTWRPYHPLTSDHDAMWGVAYAMVYQVYYQEK